MVPLDVSEGGGGYLLESLCKTHIVVLVIERNKFSNRYSQVGFRSTPQHYFAANILSLRAKHALLKLVIRSSRATLNMSQPPPSISSLCY